VARRLERSADLRPSVVVEPLDGVDRGSTLTPVIPAALFELRTPGEEAAHWAVELGRRWRHVYLAHIGVHRGCDPRHNAILHRLPIGARDVVARLRTEPERHWSGDGHDLVADLSSPVFDDVEHEHRFPAHLHLTWSWPDVPLWLSIGELTSSRCTLRLTLRSRHRWRYPARYFHAAHAALSELELDLD
jgi:hypothetical protein